MTPDLIMGIDPGQSGGISVLALDGSAVGSWKMPETESDIVELIAEFHARLAVVVIEKVGPMPKQGIASTAAFMRSYGFLRGVLAALQIRRDEVRPQEWQKALGCVPRGTKSKTDHKNALKQKAQQLWPKQKITHATADSLLLAEYARRKH